MASRLELHEILRSITPNVYYQTPGNMAMEYPAIKYERRRIENRFGSNNVYIQSRSYKIIVMDRNPDSSIVDKVAQLKSCTFESHYVVDGLNHDVFTIYY